MPIECDDCQNMMSAINHSIRSLTFIVENIGSKAVKTFLIIIINRLEKVLL
jgi:hypothetical protein